MYFIFGIYVSIFVRHSRTHCTNIVNICYLPYYHPLMWVGNVFGHVCMYLLFVQAIPFEPLHIETSFLVCRYIFPISRSNLSIKIIGQRSRSYEKNVNLTYFNILILCMLLHFINKVNGSKSK